MHILRFSFNSFLLVIRMYLFNKIHVIYDALARAQNEMKCIKTITNGQNIHDYWWYSRE